MSRKTDEEYELERWQSIVSHFEIVADGHRLVTHGAHTGHVYQTVALCENARIAQALAEAIASQRKRSKE
jgi:hypothetical protein